MNKKQWLLIFLSAMGLILHFSLGINMPTGHWINIIVYLLLIVIIINFIYILLKPKNCPNCGTKLPIFRKPKNSKQALYGGGICPNCGVELNSSENIIKEENKS